MRLLKKSALDILIPQTSQSDNFISACLLDIKEMTGCLLDEETAAKKSQHWRTFPKRFQLQLQDKIKRLVKPPKHCAKNLDDERDGKETMRHLEKSAVINDRTQLTDIFLEKQQTHFAPEITNNQDWAEANVADFPVRDKLQSKQYSTVNALTGQSILCVGGRAALYPEYHRLIASLGAHLLIYRGSLKNNMDRLYTLLENADMVICPIDCINHSDFFAVKFYCRFSGKPYTLLDRSDLATFSKGARKLSRLACQHPCGSNGYN